MSTTKRLYSGRDESVADQRPALVRSFVTITRQPGATAGDLGNRLAHELAQANPEDPWTSWDQDLVQRIASECDVPDSVIQSLDYAHHSWLDDLFHGLTMENHSKQDFLSIFRAARRAVLRLAVSGRAILVGQGAAYFTRQLPGGVHVWLIAPHDWRLAHLAERQGLDKQSAERELRRREHNQATFYRKLCNGQQLTPEFFSMTLNVASLSHQETLDSVLALLRSHH